MTRFSPHDRIVKIAIMGQALAKACPNGQRANAGAGSADAERQV
jgi:hypothetical protein